MGYQRIAGEINGLGLTVSATTVRKILGEAASVRYARGVHKRNHAALSYS
jgi:hypothetical protein